jgi:hypothetical protein
MENDARIGRVGNSYRVRVSGEVAFFSPREHGGEEKALQAARAWRDARWDGSDRRYKLTPKQRAEIATGTMDYRKVAAKYGISPNYVHQLRRGQ